MLITSHDIFDRDWTVAKNKSVEVQLYWSKGALFGVELNWIPSDRDHWGFEFSVALLGLCARAQLYDHRHADPDEDIYYET